MPASPDIIFDQVTFRYLPNGPAALSNLSLTIKAHEKLGVVGKTGSGKSTLVSLLLRLGPLRGVPPSSGGRVSISGVDISTLKLSDLRAAVAIVPQEPAVFEGSLKDNVGEEFGDAEVLSTLASCGLDVRQLTQKEEDAPVTETLSAPIAGGRATVGQMQLLMVARALVRRPKVLILDECSASLDKGLADRLFEVVKTRARDSTVLIIAHRLRLVLDADRILVLRQGEKIALDTPAKLLEDADGYFATNLRLEQLEESGAVS